MRMTISCLSVLGLLVGLAWGAWGAEHAAGRGAPAVAAEASAACLSLCLAPVQGPPEEPPRRPEEQAARGHGEPPGDAGRSPRPPDGRPRRRFERVGPPLMDWLLPAIAERRPELARKLARLRRESPERFRRLLADALITRLEQAAEREERRPFPPGEPRRPPGEPDWDEPGGHELPGPLAEIERQFRELERQNVELERRSIELAERYREIREHGGPEREAQLEQIRHELAETVERHFEVRTELRRLEFRRVEREFDRLRGVLEQIRHDLERRERARPAIIERRIGQLVGEDPESW